MELTEMEKRMLYQAEGAEQYTALQEMAMAYSMPEILPGGKRQKVVWRSCAP